MKTLFVDFETYHSTKQKYDLKHVSLVEYIRDPRFQVQGLGVKEDGQSTVWVSGNRVREYLQSIDFSNCRIIAHNVKFDGGILAWIYGVKPAQWVDTQAMSKAVLGAKVPSHSLKALASYLGLPAKGELKTNNLKDLTPEQEAELAEYCKKDVDICHDIFYTLLKYFPDSQWQVMDWTVRAFLEPKIEVNGEVCKQVSDLHIANKCSLIAKAGVDRTVLASNQQFSKLLQTEGFSVPMKANKKGKKIPALSLGDKEFLELQETTDPRLKALIDARIAVKQTLEETRAEKLSQIAKISKYCFDVIFSGAQQTHRFSGGNGCAGNPQNFGRKSQLRAALTAPKGHKLVVADFSNIELRVLAWLSRDPELMTAIRNKEDVYSKFASRIYGYEVTKQTHKKERMLGKAAVLGLGYGMGWQKFRNTVFAQTGELIDEDFAKEIVKLYRNTYRGVPRFWLSCEKVLEQIAGQSPRYFPGVEFLGLGRQTIILPSGLQVKYPSLGFTWKQMFGKWKKEWTYERFKSAKGAADKVKIYGGMVTENLCQSLAGEICKEAIQRLIDYGYSPAGQVHDELLVVCEEDEVEKVKYLVAAAMTQPISWWKDLPLEVEIGVGDNWLEAK